MGVYWLWPRCWGVLLYCHWRGGGASIYTVADEADEWRRFATARKWWLYPREFALGGGWKWVCMAIIIIQIRLSKSILFLSKSSLGKSGSLSARTMARITRANRRAGRSWTGTGAGTTRTRKLWSSGWRLKMTISRLTFRRRRGLNKLERHSRRERSGGITRGVVPQPDGQSEAVVVGGGGERRCVSVIFLELSRFTTKRWQSDCGDRKWGFLAGEPVAAAAV